MSPRRRKRFFGTGPIGPTGPSIPGLGDNPDVVDGAGLGDQLRELGAEVATEVPGHDGALWPAALRAMAEQADALERDRARWRGQISRVRAEAASWVWADDAGDPDEPTAPEIVWCFERVKVALDG